MFSAVLDVGFYPREISLPGIRPSSPPGEGGPPPPSIASPGKSAGDSGRASGQGQDVFERNQENSGLVTVRTRYAIDPDSKEVVVKVFDPETQEDLREIPTEEARELSQRIRKYQEQVFNR